MNYRGLFVDNGFGSGIFPDPDPQHWKNVFSYAAKERFPSIFYNILLDLHTSVYIVYMTI